MFLFAVYENVDNSRSSNERFEVHSASGGDCCLETLEVTSFCVIFRPKLFCRMFGQIVFQPVVCDSGRIVKLECL